MMLLRCAGNMVSGAARRVARDPAKAIKVRFWVLATQYGREWPLGFKFAPSADGSLSPDSCRSERVPITAETGHERTSIADVSARHPGAILGHRGQFPTSGTARFQFREEGF